MKYSDFLADILSRAGYTHCFFVHGGNIMHILESCRAQMVCIPFVHEHSAVVGAEYFNHLAKDGGEKAFALVTAGPGLTNSVSGIAGAWLESRELLVIGGQCKSSDLSRGAVRQRGHQEVDGVSLTRAITKKSLLVDTPLTHNELAEFLALAAEGRPGPIFLEVCLDTQVGHVKGPGFEPGNYREPEFVLPKLSKRDEARLGELLDRSERPILLVGGGVKRSAFRELLPNLENLGLPVMTSWNAADFIEAESPIYVGRPNTWGQRSANILIQQSDLIIALGARLGLQQTGFNWREFGPNADIVQVDIDPLELEKGHPVLSMKMRADASAVLESLIEITSPRKQWDAWVYFCRDVRRSLSLIEPRARGNHPTRLSPYELAEWFQKVLAEDDVIIPSSSGGSFTSFMQAYEPRVSQRIVTNKGLASMGYGLAGALGAALSTLGRVILSEGDGGFAQNLQELGTLSQLRLPVKIFLHSNDGFGTIRKSQESMFGNDWIGCDAGSGLGMPEWQKISEAFGIQYVRVSRENLDSDEVLDFLKSPLPVFFEVEIDENQIHEPKLGGRVTPEGSIVSTPIHEMSPALSDSTTRAVSKYFERKIIEPD